MIFHDGRLVPQGCYLFSYPRSGSNWLFSALAYLVGGVKAEARMGGDMYAHRYGEVGPDSFWVQAAREWPGDCPLLIKSHDRVETVRALYPEGKKISLLRDGRDALLSYYFFHQAFVANPTNKTVTPAGRRQQDLAALSGNDVRFDAADYAAFLRVHGPQWAEYTRGWAGATDALTVRYETLQADFEGELTRIVDTLDLPTVCTVREVREEYVEHARTLLQGDNRSFHRKGIVGDWKNYYDPSVRAVLHETIGDTLREVGYETGSDW